MTRGTRDFCIGCGLLGLVLVAGCTKNERRVATQNATASAVTAAQGAVATSTTPAPRKPLVKPNGRGGYDASEAQAAALKRAHYMSDKYGTINRTPRPTTRPTNRPANR
jgi:hypothetical protein